MTQLWSLTAYCPECNQTNIIQENKNQKLMNYYHTYYQTMLNDNRGVLKCKECGALYDSFAVQAFYFPKRNQRKKGR